jgi:hypothetical protein
LAGGGLTGKHAAFGGKQPDKRNDSLAGAPALGSQIKPSDELLKHRPRL